MRPQVGLLALIAAPLLLNTSCTTTTAIGAGVAITVTGFGSGVVGHEIHQVYYLGSFDPRGQIPPQLYRVTVRGQASLISSMKFGSGWVQASLIDSLATKVEMGKDGVARASQGDKCEKCGKNQLTELEVGRRLVLFGPEGFRTVPKDHRLVIVMGSSPDAFFSAMDQSLSAITRVELMQRGTEVSQDLFREYVRIGGELARLADLKRDAEATIKVKEAGL